jgi:putative transposase
MMRDTTKPDSWQPAAEMTVGLLDNWFDPIESEVRARAREFIEEMIRGELDTIRRDVRIDLSRGTTTFSPGLGG